jgi:hypothetical protein
MERGMKSDTILLGAAAAVIVLVVAFSMMDDKGNRRSLDDPDVDPVETARNVRQKVEEVEDKVAELEKTGKKIQAESSRAEKIVSELKPLVPAGGRADRALTQAESLLDKGKGLGNAITNVIGKDKAEELKEAAREKAMELAGKGAERAKSFFSDAWKSFRKKPTPYPMPPGVGSGTRD